MSKEVDDDTTDKHLTKEFWDAYQEAPVNRPEFDGEPPPRSSGGVLSPPREFSNLTAEALGLTPSDWDDPDYRNAYIQVLIIVDIANSFWLVQPGRGGAKTLDRFIDQNRGTGITVHKHDPVKDAYVVESTPELTRKMKELNFEMRPVKIGGQQVRGR